MNDKLDLMANEDTKKALIRLGLPTIVGLLMTGFHNFGAKKSSV